MSVLLCVPPLHLCPLRGLRYLQIRFFYLICQFEEKGTLSIWEGGTAELPVGEL